MRDPEAPELVLHQLAGGAYAEHSHATGDEVLTLAEPFPAALRSTALLP